MKIQDLLRSWSKYAEIEVAFGFFNPYEDYEFSTHMYRAILQEINLDRDVLLNVGQEINWHPAAATL